MFFPKKVVFFLSPPERAHENQCVIFYFKEPGVNVLWARLIYSQL
jgi:hypothetical protein